MAKGCDYSWDHPDLNCLKGQGVTFIVRYGSRDRTKNLSAGELDAAMAAGMSVAVVWQEGKTQMLRGYSGGQQDAWEADAFVKDLGLAGIPVYYSCDFDPASGDWATVDAYLDGAISVTGLARNGGYGGLPFIRREFDRGKLTWGWQTYAWSGSPTQWDPRAQLRQVKNDQVVCGGLVDWDESTAADFGQWPRPPGPAAAGGEMTSAVAFDRDNRPHYACIWENGQVRFRGPAMTTFEPVDPNSNAKGGLSMAIDGNGRIVITYVNQSGAVCTYNRPAGSQAFSWASLGGTARA